MGIRGDRDNNYNFGNLCNLRAIEYSNDTKKLATEIPKELWKQDDV